MLWLGISIYLILGLGTLKWTLRRTSKKDYLASLPSDQKWGVSILAIVFWPLVLVTGISNRVKP